MAKAWYLVATDGRTSTTRLAEADPAGCLRLTGVSGRVATDGGHTALCSGREAAYVLCLQWGLHHGYDCRGGDPGRCAVEEDGAKVPLLDWLCEHYPALLYGPMRHGERVHAAAGLDVVGTVVRDGDRVRVRWDDGAVTWPHGR